MSISNTFLNNKLSIRYYTILNFTSLLSNINKFQLHILGSTRKTNYTFNVA